MNSLFIFLSSFSHFNVTSFSKKPSWTVHIKINYEADCIGSFLKKHRNISRTIAKVKIELLVALVCSFQLLTNFTKNLNVGAIGVLIRL